MAPGKFQRRAWPHGAIQAVVAVVVFWLEMRVLLAGWVPHGTVQIGGCRDIWPSWEDPPLIPRGVVFPFPRVYR